MRAKIYAYCSRVEMIGGGTSYDVLFRCADKPSRPLHGGHIYATKVLRSVGGTEFYRVFDAIDPKSRWGMELGWEKYEAGQKLERVANRLAYRIAKRAFPELKKLGKLPAPWAPWTLPSAEKRVAVNIQLPE